jgi:pimeloyl-ACP methyl ester carboxylesterase
MAVQTLHQGLAIEYELTGAGDNVVLIPGLGNRRSAWMDLLASLSPEFHVLSYDLRGYSGEAPNEQFTIKQLAEDLLALLDSLRIETTHVVGHSQGGFIALELALARPQLVSSLVLGASASYTDSYGRHLLRNWRRLLHSKDLDMFFNEVFLWNYSPGFFNDRPRELNVLKSWAGRDGFDANTYLRHNLACETHDARDRLQKIACPTLLLGGAQDIVMGLRHNLLLQQLIPGAELVTLPNAAHQLFAENVDQTCPLVLEFIRRQARDRSLTFCL